MTIPKNVIRQRFEVRESGRTATHGQADASAPIGGTGGNLLFIGLPGSGRKTLARSAAARLGLAYAAAADAQALEYALARSGQAIAVTGTVTGMGLGAPEARERLRAAGKVFYLMSVAPILAKRLGDLSRLEELAQAVTANEPFFLQAAHFVLPLDATPEEMVEDVVEKASLS